MGNDAICLEKQGECGAMADAMPVASVEGGDSLIDGLNDKVDVLESKIELLQGTFDVWQKLVESILGTAQTAIAYDSNLIAVVGIGAGIVAVIVAIAIAVMNYIYNKKKGDAVSDAIKEINESLEKGVLPEKSGLRSKIIGSIINTNEFKEQVVSILDKYSTFSSKSSYENIDKTDETKIDSKSLKKTDTNNEG